ncbi:MAG TPA: cytochrome-c peroxidase, partial [Flavobacteriales bacterium]|nr:cytochrome-c peroxidase [Flavobacteriales bacterium]
MNSAIRSLSLLMVAIVSMMAACKPDKTPDDTSAGGGGTTVVTTPYALQVPANFPPMEIPEDNQMTVEGVTLGRYLFYEEKLSGNNTQSCGSCHAPAFCFSDNGHQFSLGIDGMPGTRNSMALQNLGWGARFFWDGRAMTLEDQILQPVENPIEMHETWPNAVADLQADPAYVTLFNNAFGGSIDKYKAAKAIAQFLRTMISGNSRFDQFQRGEITLNTDEQLGILLTQQEGGDPGLGLGGQWGADCFHCHPHGGAL